MKCLVRSDIIKSYKSSLPIGDEKKMYCVFSLHSVQMGELLGEGAFGQVQKGYVIGFWGKMEPVEVAIKMLKGEWEKGC